MHFHDGGFQKDALDVKPTVQTAEQNSKIRL